MKTLMRMLAIVLLLGMMVSLAACGGESAGDSGTVQEETTAADTSEQETSADTAASTTDEVKAEIVVEKPADNPIPSVDPSLTDASILGEWTDIEDAARFAKITKTDSGYQYEDNEGSYAGEFKDGALLLNVSDTDTVQVYFDVSSQNLISIYQGTPSRFKKK